MSESSEAGVRLLVVRKPSGEERHVPLGAEPVTLGRGDDCTIRLESPFVSRRHARIALTPEGAVLTDLASHNGSLVNGKPIAGPTLLVPGDEVLMADVTIDCQAAPSATIPTRTYVRPQMGPDALAADAVPLGANASAAGAGAPDAGLRVDARTHEVWTDGQPLETRLSAQEFKLLAYLYEHRDRVCTRKELGDAIWGRDTWDPNMLHRLVRRLKKKIEADPQQPRFVQTVPWVGYRLAA